MSSLPEIDRASVRLRPATPGDQAFLRRLYASTREDELALVDWTKAEKDEFVDMQFRAQATHYAQHYADASFQIVQLGLEPAGQLAVDRGVDEIRIVDISLLPEHRNRGIGTALLAGLIGEARACEKPLTIHVERLNPAQSLYERLGFSPIGDEGVYLLMRWSPTGGAGHGLR